VVASGATSGVASVAGSGVTVAVGCAVDCG